MHLHDVFREPFDEDVDVLIQVFGNKGYINGMSIPVTDVCWPSLALVSSSFSFDSFSSLISVKTFLAYRVETQERLVEPCGPLPMWA